MFNTATAFKYVLLAASLQYCFSKHYSAHEKVSLVANTVGPFNNPTETYPYFSLPFCEGTGKQRRHKQALGETLAGSRKVATPHDITFLDPVPWRSLCEEYMEPEDLEELKHAIEEDYFFEMFIDDLPMWGYVGEVIHEEFLLGRNIQGARVYLYPHLHFSIGYSNDQIVAVNVTTDPKRRVDITDTNVGKEIVFSYSVEWLHQPHIKYEQRMERYHDSAFLPSTFEIHWLSIINAFVLVILLTTFLAIILMRILKKDFSRYMEVDDEELQEEETGWKLIKGDVFRTPKHTSLFCAVIGAGAQIFATAVVILVFVLTEILPVTRRGAILTATIVTYAFCGFVGGLVTGRLYKQLGGTRWVTNVLVTSVIFPLPLALVFSWMNSVAWTNNSTAALPATTIMVWIPYAFIVDISSSLWRFWYSFIFPFWSLVRYWVEMQPQSSNRRAGNLYHDYGSSCLLLRTNKVPREIPKQLEWYRSPVAQLFMAGFLPFSAIYIELHYIFASIWGHKIYTLFGILFLAFVMLSVVASFVTIALLYFQLVKEDHQWWWRSFFNGGATGLFILGYAFYYFFHRSKMDGLLQASYYFGYMGMLSYAFVLLLGFIGFYSSFTFVNYIYGAVKTD